MPEERPAPAVNNRIPPAVLWTFGLVFLAVTLALPFVLFRIMAATQNQSRGMTLVLATGLPFDARRLRPSVRENPEAGAFAARCELPPADAAAAHDALTATGAPDPVFLATLAILAPGETRWVPQADSRGPWRSGAGTKDGLRWRALLDEGSGTLWICGEREKP